MFRYSNRGVNMIPDKYRDEKDYRKIPRQYLEPNIPKGEGRLSGNHLLRYLNNMNVSLNICKTRIR